MERVGAFPVKIAMVLRALSLSRVALAHELAIDKSLVGRWLSGAVHPTEHNLQRLTSMVSKRIGGFSMGDWYLDVSDLALRIGTKVPTSAADLETQELSFLGSFLARTREETVRRGHAYEGFWRTTRPSLLMPEQLFHDYGIIRRNANGLLEVRMRGAGLTFGGWMLPGEGNLFVFLDDPVGMTPLSLVIRGVSLPRAMVLEGLLMLAALDAGRTLGAVPILLERLGDLGADRAVDEARFERLLEELPEPLEPLGDVVIANWVERARSREFLLVGVNDSLSRGTTAAGLSG